MSFVFIENTCENVSQIDYWIKKTRNESNDEQITPDFAMQVLSKTNHAGHIKTILRNIGDKCGSIKERLAYKEFVLSAIDGRSHGSDVTEYLTSLAEEGGYLDEFKKADAKNKRYGSKDCVNKHFVKMEKQISPVVADEMIEQALNGYQPNRMLEILKYTNQYINVKKMVQSAVMYGGQDSANVYGDFILSCVTGREVSPQVFELMKRWADKRGLSEELEKANSITKVYDYNGRELSHKDKNEEAIKSLKSLASKLKS